MNRHALLFCSVATSFLLFGALVGGQDAPPAPRDEAPVRVEPRRESEEPHNEFRPRRDTTDMEREIVRELFHQKQEELKRRQEKLRQEFRERTERRHEADEKVRMKERPGQSERSERRRNLGDRPDGQTGHEPGSVRPDRPDMAPREGGDPENRNPNRPGSERREHLKQAIQHLHAAGMHALADRLTQEMHQRQQRPQNRPPGTPRRGYGMQSQPDRGPSRGPEDRDLERPNFQRQLDDLRRQLEEMRRRIEAAPGRGPRRPESGDVW